MVHAGKPRLVAHGVLFMNATSTAHKAFFMVNGGKIILLAGATGSPQILMPSGIGLADHLRSSGIQVVLDRSMVGQKMTEP